MTYLITFPHNTFIVSNNLSNRNNIHCTPLYSTGSKYFTIWYFASLRRSLVSANVTLKWLLTFQKEWCDTNIYISILIITSAWYSINYTFKFCSITSDRLVLHKSCPSSVRNIPEAERVELWYAGLLCWEQTLSGLLHTHRAQVQTPVTHILSKLQTSLHYSLWYSLKSFHFAWV